MKKSENDKLIQAAVLAMISMVVEASGMPVFSLSEEKAPVTLRATLQESAEKTPTFFPSSSMSPPSLQKARSKYMTAKAVGAKTASLVNFVFDLRGFDWSKEGANAILEEKLKPKGEPAKEFLRHKEEDERELSVVTSTLQLASVQGRDEGKTKDALASLAQLTNEDEAARLDQLLKSVSTSSSGSIDPSEKASADVVQKCDRLKLILQSAADHDPVVEAMTKRLHKYNHRNKLLQITAKVVYAGLGVASFAPTLVAPIAETTLLTFMMVTGGPEQDKLLKELYLSKCLQSRARLINEKAHLAVDCYDMAVLTKNERLLACAKDLIKQMTDEKTVFAFTTGTTALDADADEDGIPQTVSRSEIKSKETLGISPEEVITSPIANTKEI